MRKGICYRMTRGGLGFLLPLAFAAVWSVLVPRVAAQAPPVQAGGGDYIVTFRLGTSQANRAASAQRAGAILRFNYAIVDAIAVRIPNANVLAALQRDPSVLEIIPDRPVRAFQAPDANPNARPGGGGGTSTGEVVPEGVKRVGAPTATSNGDGVGIAILDTGLDFAHRDLDEGLAWFDAFGGNCADGVGHATHVAGIATALDNEVDVIGVAPKARPYCVKVLDDTGHGTDGTIMAGLDWVALSSTTDTARGFPVSPPIRAVNMSLGREGTLNDNPSLRAFVKALYDKGIVVVVAAGNDERLEVSQNVPATYPEVLAVASTTAVDGKSAKCAGRPVQIKADTASFFTTDGKFDPSTAIGVTSSAPGEDKEDVSGCVITSVGILSLKLGGGTTRKQGTSMSAPHVAGIVARLMQTTGPTQLSGVETIRSWLRTNAFGVGNAPLPSPAGGYTDDGEREGIAKAP